MDSKLRVLSLTDIKTKFPKVTKESNGFTGSYISHKFLKDIEKRTNYYSSLCSSPSQSPLKYPSHIKREFKKLPGILQNKPQTIIASNVFPLKHRRVLSNFVVSISKNPLSSSILHKKMRSNTKYIAKNFLKPTRSLH